MARIRGASAVGALGLLCVLALIACAGEDENGGATPSPLPVTATPAPILSASPTTAATVGSLGAYAVTIADGRLTQLAAGEGYSIVSWTQDGGSLTLSQGETTGNQDTYSVNADGSELTLTATIDGWVGPWSPATRAIIRYQADKDQSTGLDQYGLYVTSPGARLGRWVADGFLGVWSPDGQRIAFVGNFCDETRDYVGVVNVDGSGLVKLTDIVDALQVGHAWSPDSRTLAFSAPDEEGVLQIYLADMDSGGRFQLTEGPWPKMQPSWSADGSLLAYASLEGEGPSAAPTHWFVPKEGGDAVQLPAGLSDLQWSPKGRSLAFVKGTELEALDVDGGGAPTTLAQLGESDQVDFHWSPNGRHVAFLSDGRLYVVGVDGSGLKDLTGATFLQTGEGGEPLIIDSIRWSPGGTKIAFAVVRPIAARPVCG